MPLTLASILAESAVRHADRTAVVIGDLKISYAQLWGGCSKGISSPGSAQAVR